MQLSELLETARISVAAPRDGYRRIAALNLSQQELLMALAAVSLTGFLLGEVMFRIMAVRGEAPMLDFGTGPFGSALIQLLTGLVSALAIARIGRIFGGIGSFDDALLAVVWVQFILTLLTVVQLVAVLVLPPLAGLLGMVGLGLLIWLSSGFIAELHGFRSQAKTAAGMIGSLFAISFALVFVLLLLGVNLPEFTNV